ncbi:hypothetical protein Hanom_Chr04g00342431 [Helianthus anomalus]
MKRVLAMWYVMVEPFADVACYGGGFRREATLDCLLVLERGIRNHMDNPITY